MFRNIVFMVNCYYLTQTSELWSDDLLLPVCDCLLSIFAGILHIGGRYALRKLRTRCGGET